MASRGVTPARQVALLRGINVGSAQRIAMATLRELVSAQGYSDVSTHLQSGNLLLASPLSPDEVARDVEQLITRELGLDVAVVVRTRDELAGAVARNPLLDVATDPARMLVSFLDAAPEPATLDGVDARDFAPERFALVGRELYLWCPEGILASRLVKTLSDKRLGVTATARNWRTVTRLLELLEG